MKYEETVEGVRTFVAHEVAMASGSGVVPMDVGHAHAENDRAWGNEEECEDEKEVGAVSMNTQRHACQGWGHVRRDCPTVADGANGAPREKAKTREERRKRWQVRRQETEGRQE